MVVLRVFEGNVVPINIIVKNKIGGGVNEVCRLFVLNDLACARILHKGNGGYGR